MPLEREVQPRERILIGATVSIEVVSVGRGSVRVRIAAPFDIPIQHEVRSDKRIEKTSPRIKKTT